MEAEAERKMLEAEVEAEAERKRVEVETEAEEQLQKWEEWRKRDKEETVAWREYKVGKKGQEPEGK